MATRSTCGMAWTSPPLAASRACAWRSCVCACACRASRTPCTPWTAAASVRRNGPPPPVDCACPCGGSMVPSCRPAIPSGSPAPIAAPTRGRRRRAAAQLRPVHPLLSPGRLPALRAPHAHVQGPVLAGQRSAGQVRTGVASGGLATVLLAAAPDSARRSRLDQAVRRSPPCRCASRARSRHRPGRHVGRGRLGRVARVGATDAAERLQGGLPRDGRPVVGCVIGLRRWTHGRADLSGLRGPAPCAFADRGRHARPRHDRPVARRARRPRALRRGAGAAIARAFVAPDDLAAGVAHELAWTGAEDRSGAVRREPSVLPQSASRGRRDADHR